MKTRILFLTFLLVIGFFFNFQEIKQIIQTGQDFLLKNTLISAIIITCFSFSHIIRSINIKKLLDIVSPLYPKPTLKYSSSFNTFFIGYLINFSFPFRLGDIARALLLAKRLNIGSGTTFIMIAIERIIDCIILSIFALFCFFLFVFTNNSFSLDFMLLYSIINNALILLSIGLILFSLAFILFKETNILLVFSHKVTSYFNYKIKNQLRFKIWSSIHGMHIIFRNSNKLIFLARAITMWVFYFIGSCLIAYELNPELLKSIFIASQGLIQTSTKLNMEQLGVISANIAIILKTTLQAQDILNYLVLTIFTITFFQFISAFIILGITIIFFKKESLDFYDEHIDPRTNKVQRFLNISDTFVNFLENYFSGVEIFKQVNLLELSGDIKILSTFNGGSNAITFLATSPENDSLFVRKICNLKHASKLKAQHDWLNDFKGEHHFPQIITEAYINEMYYYDLAFDPSAVPLFEYIHSHSAKENQNILKDIFDYLVKKLYSSNIEVIDRKLVANYINQKIVQKIEETKALAPDLANLLGFDEIIVNGEKLKNLKSCIEIISSHSKMLDDLAKFRQSNIHGDLTVENIVVTDNSFLILDPNNENAISSIVVDIAKFRQSIHSGYEFLLKCDKVLTAANKISFSSLRSEQYLLLDENLIQLSKYYLSEVEFKSLLFHEAVHYVRLLPYRAKQTPKFLPIYYAVATKLFNEYINQYGNFNDE